MSFSIDYANLSNGSKILAAEAIVYIHCNLRHSSRMEVLAACMDWRTRYLSHLGKIKMFLKNYSACQANFELIRSEENILTDSFIICAKTATISEANDLDEYGNIDDETPLTDLQYQALSNRAIEELTSILLRINSLPAYSMKLSPLCTLSKWNVKFHKLGKLKAWLTIMLPTMPSCVHHLGLLDNQGAGNDIVFYRQQQEFPPLPPANETYDANAINEAMTPPVQQPESATALPGPAVTYRQFGEQHGVQSESGVLPSDYFSIPHTTNNAEVSYQKASRKTTEMFEYLVGKGILSDSIKYGQGQFEEFEWRGDAVLHLELTNIQFASQSSLFDTQGLHDRRVNAERNLTLALLFDELHLAKLIQTCPPAWSHNHWKVKGDFIEAMIGELYTRLNDCGNGFIYDSHDRSVASNLIKRIAQAALERGSKLISAQEQNELTDAATAAGGGGFLCTSDDRDATIRCPRRI